MKQDNGVKITLLVSGSHHPLSVYNIGDEIEFVDMSKLAGYVTDQVGTVLSKTIGALFTKKRSNEKDTGASETDCEVLSLPSVVDFEDPKRRVLKLIIDPSKSLVAAADSLGRVTLYDTKLFTIVRLWKGLRDARLAWTEDIIKMAGV
jgi:hypothetical protein